MTEEKQEGQKTVVSFIVGLLIGGLLVWAFSGPSADAPETNQQGEDKEEQQVVEQDEEDEDMESSSQGTEDKDNAQIEASAIKSQTNNKDNTLSVGEGRVVVEDQSASAVIDMESATYPVSEGWIGVREYSNGQLGYILGVVRFSEEQGLVPDEIILQRSTTAGKEYAVVVYEENGDRVFNLADDKQIDTIFATFTAK